MMKDRMKDQMYWLAVNQASCAMCDLPATAEEIECTPTPQQLIGFKSRDEAKEWQQFMLTAPIHQVKARAKKGLDRDKVTIITPANPEEPCDKTLWTIQKQGNEK